MPHCRGTKARCTQRHLQARDRFGDKKSPWWHCGKGAIPSPCPKGASKASWLSVGTGNGVAWEEGGSRAAPDDCTLWGCPMSPCPGDCRRCPGRCLWYHQRQLLQAGCVRVSRFLCGLQGILLKERRGLYHTGMGPLPKTRAVCMVRGSFQVAGEQPTQSCDARGACRIPMRSMCRRLPRSWPWNTSKSKQDYPPDYLTPGRAAELIAILLPLCHVYPSPLHAKHHSWVQGCVLPLAVATSRSQPVHFCFYSTRDYS